MGDYLLLVHSDTQTAENDWEPYLAALETSGHLRGGSAIGAGACFRKAGGIPPVTAHLVGFVRVEAASLSEAAGLLAGNPVYEAGGTVEIRELPRTSRLDGRRATSNKIAWQWVTAQGPAVDWVRRARWVDDGDVVTSSGVSAGIDMALAVIARLHGQEAAERSAKLMEYNWNRDPDNDPFA